MHQLIMQYGVYLVALIIFAGELGVPTGVPAEVAMLLAGSYAVRSVRELALGLLLVSLGDFLGTLTLHIAARTGGVRLLERLRIRKSGDMDVTERWRKRLGGHDALVVFVTRLLPLVRMWATIGSGLIPVRLSSFVIGAIPASIIWAGTPLVAGYLLKGSVRRFEQQYTGISHLTLLLLPAMTLGMTALWWAWHGRSRWSKLRRGRLVLGLAVCIGALVFLVRAAIIGDRDAADGYISLPLPILVAWLGVLALLALGLLVIALQDLQVAHREITRDHPVPRLEVTSAVIWVFLVITLGATMTWIEFQYPAL